MTLMANNNNKKHFILHTNISLERKKKQKQHLWISHPSNTYTHSSALKSYKNDRNNTCIATINHNIFRKKKDNLAKIQSAHNNIII